MTDHIPDATKKVCASEPESSCMQKVGEASESSAHKLGEFMDALRDGERKDVSR